MVLSPEFLVGLVKKKIYQVLSNLGVCLGKTSWSRSLPNPATLPVRCDQVLMYKLGNIMFWDNIFLEPQYYQFG